MLLNSKRNCRSRRLNSSPCLSILMVAFPQPSGPQKSQSATKHLLRRWPSYIQSRRNRQKNRNNRIRIRHKCNLLQNRQHPSPVDHSLPPSMPERLEYPPAELPGLPGCEYQKRYDCLPAHYCTLLSLLACIVHYVFSNLFLMCSPTCTSLF